MSCCSPESFISLKTGAWGSVLSAIGRSFCLAVVPPREEDEEVDEDLLCFIEYAMRTWSLSSFGAASTDIRMVKVVTRMAKATIICVFLVFIITIRIVFMLNILFFTVIFFPTLFSPFQKLTPLSIFQHSAQYFQFPYISASLLFFSFKWYNLI